MQRYLVFKFVGKTIEIYNLYAVKMEAAISNIRIILPTYKVFCNTDIDNNGVFAIELESLKQESLIVSEVAKAFNGMATGKLN